MLIIAKIRTLAQNAVTLTSALRGVKCAGLPPGEL